PGPPSDDRLVVTELAVAVQLHEVAEGEPQVVQRVRPAWMASDLNPLDRGQSLVDVPLQRLKFTLQRPQLRGDIQAALAGQLLKAFNLLFDLSDRLLKIQMGNSCHDRSVPGEDYP